MQREAKQQPSVRRSIEPSIVLKNALSLVRRDGLVLTLIALAVVAAPKIVLELAAPGIFDPPTDWRSFAFYQLAGAGLWIVRSILPAYAASALASQASSPAITLTGATPSVPAFASRLPSVLITALGFHLAFLTGLVLLIAPGALVALALCVSLQVAAVEKATIRQIFSRCATLTKGRRTDILWFSVLVYIPVAALYLAGMRSIGGVKFLGGSQSIAAIIHTPEAKFIVTPLTGVITSVWIAACFAALYLDLGKLATQTSPPISTSADAAGD